MLQRELADEAATERFASGFARALERLPALRGYPLVLHLRGELGAGKTTFARGLLRALGTAARIRSPSYTLLERYAAGAFDVLHLDLYRLEGPTELEPLALAEHLEPGTLWLIEWPERGGTRVPTADLHVELQILPAAHGVSVRAETAAGRELLAMAQATMQEEGVSP